MDEAATSSINAVNAPRARTDVTPEQALNPPEIAVSISDSTDVLRELSDMRDQIADAMQEIDDPEALAEARTVLLRVNSLMKEIGASPTAAGGGNLQRLSALRIASEFVKSEARRESEASVHKMGEAGSIQNISAKKDSTFVFRAPKPARDPNEIVCEATPEALAKARGMTAETLDDTEYKEMNHESAALQQVQKERVGVHADERRANASRQTFGETRQAPSAQLKRSVRKQGSAVRETTANVAEGLGILDAKGANTARDLERQRAGARTEEEYQYVRQETLDAYDRRVLGRTFIGQEVDKALTDLERKGYTDKIGGVGSSVTGLRTSDVMAKLKENGWVAGGTNNWNPFSHAANSEWSDQAVKKLDLNKDGQLSAAEIQYGLDHTRNEHNLMRIRRATDAGVQKVTQAAEAGLQKAEDVKDKAADAYAARGHVGKELKELVGVVQASKFAKMFDTDRDGKVELHELRTKLKAMGVSKLEDIDRNHDGDISAGELGAVIGKYNTAHKPPAKPQNGK